MLQKILQITNKAKQSIQKVTVQLKNEKEYINQKNLEKNPTQSHFNHIENFKEYTEILKDVYVKDTYSKLKNLAKKEKDQYLNELEKTIPKQTVQEYKNKILGKIYSFKSQTINNNNNKTQQDSFNQQKDKSNYQSQNAKQQNNWSQYFNKIKQDKTNEFKEKKTIFDKLKEAKLKNWNYMFTNSFEVAKGVGKTSFKYILIGIFVFGIAYSTPKSIAHYFATKHAVQQQLNIENLKRENENLKNTLNSFYQQGINKQNDSIEYQKIESK